MGQPNEGPNGGVGKKGGDLVRVKRHKSQLELAFGAEVTGEAPRAAPEGTEACTARAGPNGPAVRVGPSMDRVVERDNLRKALAQVRRNKGAPGLDGMSVEDLAAYLKDHWPEIRDQLLQGTYKPQPVRRIEIPKASGGTRPLGIPTVPRFQAITLTMTFHGWGCAFEHAAVGPDGEAQ